MLHSLKKCVSPKRFTMAMDNSLSTIKDDIDHIPTGMLLTSEFAMKM